MNGVTCPICGRRLTGSITDWPSFPFCSQRCKMIDLGRWLEESYSIPVEEPDDDVPLDPPEPT